MNPNSDIWPKNMLDHELLQSNLSIQHAKRIQAKYILKKEGLEKDFQIRDISTTKAIQTVVGVDISYDKNQEDAVASAVLYDTTTSNDNVIETTTASGKIKFPYVPGLLGFREIPLIAQAIVKLNVRPDVIMYDGHGTHHPKKFGAAVMIGMAFDLSSIGVAKNPLIGDRDQWKKLEKKKGSKQQILLHDEIVGYAICTSDDHKPVFVSPGYAATLEFAVELTLETTKSQRLPEPIYLADQFSKRELRNIV